MKGLQLLWTEMAKECAIRCCTSASRDIETVTVRTEHEGWSFMTITLPVFGKDLQRALDEGRVDHTMFQGFSWHGGLPRFLGGFLDLVFDRSTGALLDEPSYDAILSIRQLTLMFGKMLLPCSKERERDAMAEYIRCEQEVKEHWASIPRRDLLDFHRVGRLLFSSAFTWMDREIHSGERVVPRHGPGATADGLRGNAKFLQRTWPKRLEKYFSSADFLLPNYSFYDELDQVDLLEPGAEIPVKVVPVPKTLKTPRIIGVEPTAMQYCQQALLPVILDGLGRCTAGSMLGFDDQTPNQRMAQQGSSDGSLATLDLSEASDRVSNQLVRLLLSDHPHLSGAVDSCRSRKADVPGFGVQRLAKFASMGSAITFPMEAMVFLTMIFVGIERSLRVPLTQALIREYLDSVRVYGDDIIIPVDHVHEVIASLRTFGSKVGTDKSFWTGKFRESCGKEYYDGDDVSIVKVRREFPESPQDAAECVSLVSLRNQLYWAGYWQTVRWLDEQVVSVIRHFPVVEPNSPALGRESVLPYQVERSHKRLHKPLVKAWVVSATPPVSKLDGYAALLKFFLKRGDLPNPDRNHLERSGRPRAVNIKLGWVQPY